MSDRAGPKDPRLRKFGSHLRQLREQADMTMEELAAASGIAVRQLSRAEAGTASPSLLWLMDVAAGLGIGIGALVDPAKDK